MAFEIFIPYRSNGNDASLDMISRFSRTIRKGFVSAWQDTTQNVINEAPGPLIVPRVGTLEVDITPGSGVGWIAISDDGMVVREKTATYGPFTVVASVKNYLVLRAKYNPSAGAEVITFDSMTESNYNASPIKAELIIVGTLTLGATTDASTGTTLYAERNRIEGFFDTPWRPSVDTLVNLPTIGSDPFLKSGDSVVVRDSFTFYIWNGTAWVTMGGASTLHVSMGLQDPVIADHLRTIHGSGILSGGLTSGNYAREPRLVPHDLGIADKIGIGEIRAIINGHIIKTKHIDHTLVTKPGAGERYDLVYMEVLRTEIVNPSTITYEAWDGSFLTPATIATALESLTATSTEAVTSFDLTSVERTHDNKYVLVVYSIRNISDISLAAATDIYDLASYTTLPTNSDAQNWSHASSYDTRLWISTHSSSYDGKAWAIPLLVLKRTSAETAGPTIFRGDLRHVFEVYPEADIGPKTREMPDNISGLRTMLVDNTMQSGVMQSDAYSGPAVGYTDSITLSVKGYRIGLAANGTKAISVPAPPAAGSRRDLVYCTVRFLAHTDNPVQGRRIFDTGEYRVAPTYTVGYHKKVYVQTEFIMESVGEVEDAYDAFTALGYTRSTTDAGLWSKADASFDDRVNFDQVIYAIPVQMVHRFNTQAYDAALNPNGGSTGTRPDGRDAAVITADDVIPVSHLVNVGQWQLDQILNKSIDSLMRGDLKTTLVRHPSHSGVTGTKLLMAEAVSTAPVAGFTLYSAPPDNWRHVWSEASEIRPFGTAFAIDADYSDAVFTYTFANGNLNIAMPTGMAMYISESDPAAIHFVHYESSGPPSLPKVSVDGYTVPGSEPGAIIGINNFVINSTDSFGNPTDVDCRLMWSGTGKVSFFFWASMERSTSDVQHTINGGLILPPDKPIRAEIGVGFANKLGVKPMSANISKAITTTSVSFSAANLAASIDESGAATFQCLMGVSVNGTLRSAYTYTAQINDVQDTLTITFNVNLNGLTCNVLVGYQTADVTRWIEFSRAGKSVSGLYQWRDIEWTGMTTSRHVASLGDDKRQGIMAGCFMSRNTATSDPWDIIDQPVSSKIKIWEGTSFVDIKGVVGPSGTKDYRIVVVTMDAPDPATDIFRFYYEATPYMGISGLFSASDKVSAIKDHLQGEVLLSGKTFVTSAGYAPYFVDPGSVATAAPPRSGYDQDFRTNYSNRAIALATSGQSFRRLRVPSVGQLTDIAQTTFSMTKEIPKNGLDAIIDRLPWPDFTGALRIPSGAGVDWEAGTVDLWDLKYEPILTGGTLTSQVMGGGFLYWCDDRNIAEEVGSRRPQEGLVVEYNDSSSAETALEDSFFSDGDRGVSIAHYGLSYENDSTSLFVASCVGFLAPGNLEGLYMSEREKGTAGFIIPADPPNYMTVGTSFRISASSIAQTYYGGHATLIRATNGSIAGVISLQVSGSPRRISQAYPKTPYAVQIGGVFDAFWPMHRPLLPTSKES